MLQEDQDRNMLTDSEIEDIFHQIEPLTMTSRERVEALVRAVEYLAENDIAGDFVECGVWKGGSIFAMMLTLQRFNDRSRRIWAYDTFAGMTAPAALDISIYGESAAETYSEHTTKGQPWFAVSRATVEKNIAQSGYPMQNVRLVEGDIQTTLRRDVPSSIALLRLDTDWYDSTLLELQILYPRLVQGGVMIIDDYGHWKGAKRAVDEYFSKRTHRPLLQRIDYTGRLVLKCA